MTRKEEIKYASKDYVNYLLDKQEYHNENYTEDDIRQAFEKGAQWADDDPKSPWINVEMEEMWLARDNSGSLYMFIGAKPNKYKYTWHNPMAVEILMIGRSMFPEVKWSDEEPTKVKLIIDK